jgi:hypothetical protein
MDPETLKQYQVLADATSDASDEMMEAASDLVNELPTTLAGIMALCGYLAPQLDDEQNHLPDTIDWDDGTSSTPGGALANIIRVSLRKIIERGLA